MKYVLLAISIAMFFAGCTKSPYKPPDSPDDESPANWHLVYISEIVSNNVSVIADEFDDYDDYIEIYNPQDTIVNLASFGLSDDVGEVKYEFPPFAVIGPDSAIIVWCDSEPEQGNSHADFRINSTEGEWIGIFDSDGDIVDSIAVPPLPPDTAYINETGNYDDWHIGTPSP